MFRCDKEFGVNFAERSPGGLGRSQWKGGPARLGVKVVINSNYKSASVDHLRLPAGREFYFHWRARGGRLRKGGPYRANRASSREPRVSVKVIRFGLVKVGEIPMGGGGGGRPSPFHLLAVKFNFAGRGEDLI